MSAILFLIVIIFFILGILILLSRRPLEEPAQITPNSLYAAGRSERTQKSEAPNLKDSTTSAASRPSRVPSKREMIPVAVQGTKSVTTQASQNNALLWAGIEPPFIIRGYTVKNPLIYWSHGNVFPDEASCLDTKLPVGQPHNPSTPLLPYWPRYSQITPDQRAKYLLWLSTGKDNDLEEIGYAFLYFYGLERRAVIDKKDFDRVVPEVRRLLKRYRISGSFDTYLGNFLAYIAAIRLETFSEDDLREYFPDMTELTESMTRVTLAWYAQKGKTLPWQLAYSVARHFSRIAIPSVVKMETSYLEKLFQTRYLTAFDGGFSVVPAKNPYRFEYKPANPSLLISYSNIPSASAPAIVPCSLPNPLGRKRQFSNLFSLWESCVQDLRPFLTKFSKDKGAITWQAYASLPEELKSTLPHPDQDTWDRLFRENRHEKPWALVTTSSLAEVIGIEKRNRLTAVQSRSLAQTVRDSGYIFLPDVRHAGNSYLWDETLVLLPLPTDGKGNLDPSFSSHALILELGVGIAASDGHIDPSERTYLRTFFEENFVISSFEKQCLEALEDLYIQKPPSLTRLGKRLKEGLDPDTRLPIAQYLVEMSRADGTVDQKEKTNLNRIFKAMEIEEGYLHWLLTRAEKIDPADTPIIVRSGAEYTGGEILPQPAPEVAPFFSIDKGAVARILIETKEVSEILGEIFTKEETDAGEFVLKDGDPPEAVQVVETSASDYNMEGLPARYAPVLEQLLTAEVWTRDEYVHLIQCHNCMPQATLDAINIWAEAELGDFLLEDEDDSVRVYRDLIKSRMGE